MWEHNLLVGNPTNENSIWEKKKKKSSWISPARGDIENEPLRLNFSLMDWLEYRKGFFMHEYLIKA